jgi:hypothetical protein
MPDNPISIFILLIGLEIDLDKLNQVLPLVIGIN